MVDKLVGQRIKMQILISIYLLIILIGILTILFILFTKEILTTLNETGSIIRWFLFKNSGFFKIFFILIFFFEQFIFIYILNMFFNISIGASAFIGIFALIVITTATFQAFIWEQKFKYSEEMRNSAESAEDVIDEQEEIINHLLNKLKKEPNKSKKK